MVDDALRVTINASKSLNAFDRSKERELDGVIGTMSMADGKREIYVWRELAIEMFVA